MKTAFIIHGAYGHPEENWIPWLKKELQKSEWAVSTPTFPTPEGQSLENWLKVFEKDKQFIQEDSILIGHSIGVAFILRFLEQSNIKIKAAYFISGFIHQLGRPVFDDVNKTFFEKPFDGNQIRKSSLKFHIFCSDDDPYVPHKEAIALQELTKGEMHITPKAGHFNVASGYSEFHELKKTIDAD